MPDLIQTAPCPRWRQSDGPLLAAPQRTACPAAHGAPWNELRITPGLPGCRTDVCLEYPLEMALVGKPEAMRHVGKLAPFARRVECPIDPPIELPGMLRQTGGCTKTTNQAITAAPGQRRQFRQRRNASPVVGKTFEHRAQHHRQREPGGIECTTFAQIVAAEKIDQCHSLPCPQAPHLPNRQALRPQNRRYCVGSCRALTGSPSKASVSAYSRRSRRNQPASRCSIRQLHAWPGNGLQACARCAGTGDQAAKCQGRFVWASAPETASAAIARADDHVYGNVEWLVPGGRHGCGRRACVRRTAGVHRARTRLCRPHPHSSSSAPAAQHVQAMRSCPPIHGRSTSGMVIEPSAFW